MEQQLGPGRTFKNKNDYNKDAVIYYGSAASPNHKKPKWRWLIIIGAIALVVIIIAASAGATTRGPKNPMAAMYDGFKNLLGTTGFDISGKIEAGEGSWVQYEDSFIYDCSVLFGEDVKGSVFNLSLISANPESFFRQIFTGDKAIIGSWDEWSWDSGLGEQVENKNPFDINEPSNYNVIDISDRDLNNWFGWYEDEIYSETGVSLRLNSLISNHRLNENQIIRSGNELGEALNDRYDMSYELKELGISRIPDIKEIRSVFEYFFYEKCEERGYVNKFLSNVTVSGNTYQFTGKLLRFVDTFEEYLYDLEDQKLVLSRIGVKSTTVRDMRKAMAVVTRGIGVGGLDDSMYDCKVTLQLDKNRVLKSMAVDTEVDDFGNKAHFYGDINVTKVNGSAINLRELDRFAEEIRNYQERNEYQQDYWGWGGLGTPAPDSAPAPDPVPSDW